jgi:hypothetical protein
MIFKSILFTLLLSIQTLLSHYYNEHEDEKIKFILHNFHSYTTHISSK